MHRNSVTFEKKSFYNNDGNRNRSFITLLFYLLRKY